PRASSEPAGNCRNRRRRCGDGDVIYNAIREDRACVSRVLPSIAVTANGEAVQAEVQEVGGQVRIANRAERGAVTGDSRPQNLLTCAIGQRDMVKVLRREALAIETTGGPIRPGRIDND